METLEKAEFITSICEPARFLKSAMSIYIPRSPGHDWQKNNKKKNISNCKAFCVSRKRNRTIMINSCYQKAYDVPLCDSSRTSRKQPMMLSPSLITHTLNKMLEKYL